MFFIIANLNKDEKGSVLVEFAICGTLFIGIILMMIVVSLWIYNAAQVEQAARLAAYHVSVTNNPGIARQEALAYMNKTLVACSGITATASVSGQLGHGVAQAQMNPLFPGVHLIIDPGSKAKTEGTIKIQKGATATREERYR